MTLLPARPVDLFSNPAVELLDTRRSIFNTHLDILVLMHTIHSHPRHLFHPSAHRSSHRACLLDACVHDTRIHPFQPLPLLLHPSPSIPKTGRQPARPWVKQAPCVFLPSSGYQMDDSVSQCSDSEPLSAAWHLHASLPDSFQNPRLTLPGMAILIERGTACQTSGKISFSLHPGSRFHFPWICMCLVCARPMLACSGLMCLCSPRPEIV